LGATSELLTQLFKALGNGLSAVVQAFGNIVLIFAILQWALPEFRERSKEWDPYSLKTVSKPDKINRGELVIEIAFTLLGLIIFNFYFDRVGIYNNLNGQWSFTPILTTAFQTYLPWLDLLWVVTILLDILLLRMNTWNTVTRLISILVSGFNIAIAASLLTHVQYLYTIEGAFGQLGGEGILQSLLNQVLIFVFAIVIITSVVKIVQMIIRIVKSNIPS
jgi:hypothetical protein